MVRNLWVLEGIVGGVATGEGDIDGRFFELASLLDVIFRYLVSGRVPEGIHDEARGGK